MKKIILNLLFLVLSLNVVLAEPFPRLPSNAGWVKANNIYYSNLQARMWGPNTYSDLLPYTGNYIRVNVSDPYPIVNNQGQQCFSISSSCRALQPGQWYFVDLRPLGVGTDPDTGQYVGAKFVIVNGVAIITGGTQNQNVNPEIHFTFARPDDNTASCTKYIGQTLNPLQVGGGVRSNVGTLIPTIDGQYKFCFSVNTSGNWPNSPAYGVNLTVQLWGN